LLNETQEKSKSNILDEIVTIEKPKPKKFINTTLTPTSPNSRETILNSAKSKREKQSILLKHQRSFNQEDLIYTRSFFISLFLK